MDLETTLLEIKKLKESSIRKGKALGKTRSQKIINLVHEYIKEEFILLGIDFERIFPKHCNNKPEIQITGGIKNKKQDVCIIPKDINTEKINDDSQDTKRIISINIRSQLSSLGKNNDTLYERTFAESFNLHLKYPEQCLGEIYLIPTKEYVIKNKKVIFKTNTRVEQYIKEYQFINGRNNKKKDINIYKYERVALVIVDFDRTIPKIYDTDEKLKEDSIIPEESTTSINGLEINSFAKDLLECYYGRFGSKNFKEISY